MKIIVDALGGDYAPQNQVAASILALKENPDIKIVLVGDENYARPVIEKAGLGDRVEYIHTLENISCDDVPTTAIKQKTNSSMVLGLDMLKKNEDCIAFVSSGSTGALLTGAFMKIGRIPGVTRPTLCPWIPTERDDVKFVLADAGANVDCKPINLVHFALMTNAYSKMSLGVENPRIALLNVGTEEAKGNELTLQTYPVLKKLHEMGKINFLGNMEARYAVSGDYDIVITDGFAGNVLLKSIEGTATMMGRLVKRAIKSNPKTMFGGLLLGGRLKKMKAEIHEDGTGGSPLLGTKKPVIKAHGNASPRAFKNAILTGVKAGSAQLTTEIQNVLAENKELIETMLTEEKK